MYSGKYAKKSNASRKHSRKTKPSLLLITLVVLIVAVVGTTVAYLVAKTDSVQNSFVPAKITTTIDENFDKEVKNNVKVTNTGDVEAYIRAAVVVTWQNDEGEVYPTAPVEGTDYTVTWAKDGWEEYGGYYYYTSAVAPGNSTGFLLTECKPVEGKAPEGYHLVVEILAEAIQSVPDTAINDAWEVQIKDGKVGRFEAGEGGSEG